MTGERFNNHESISWSEIKTRREEVKNAYPSLFAIPVMYGTKKDILCNLTKDMKGKVLDIGAAGRFMQDVCIQAGKGIDYRSMDVDTTGFHDYYSLEAVQETFDAIFLLDVIEHVSLCEGRALLRRCKELLNPGGSIILTLPNNNHPTAFASDCTHVTSYRYHEVGGALLAAGFDGLRIFRISAKGRLKHRFLAFLLTPVLKFLDMDFATGILLVAKRN